MKIRFTNMKTITYKLIIILFILKLTTANLNAEDKSLYFDFGNKYDIEHILLPHSNQDSIKVVLLLKISNSVLAFKKNDANSEQYSSKPEMELVCKDENGVIRLRKHWNKNIIANNYKEATSKTLFIKDAIYFNLKNEDYNIKIDFFNKKYPKVSKFELKIKKIDYQKDLFTTPLFSTLSKQKKAPYILNSKAYFDKNGIDISIPIISTSSSNSASSLKIEYKLKRVQNENDDDDDDITDNIFKNYDKTINLSGECKLEKSNFNFSNSQYNLDFKSAETGTYTYAHISVDASNIYPGSYILELNSADSHKENKREYKFEIVWNDKPLSLTDIEYAIKKMKYILTEQKYDDMESGSDQEQLNKFVKHWESLDPTKQTPFNEALNQYYSRVDYSFFNFSTMTQKDGSASDRGKIYILHGAPSSIRPLHRERKTQYIWTYPKLKKEFLFEVISSGIIKLIKINSI